MLKKLREAGLVALVRDVNKATFLNIVDMPANRAGLLPEIIRRIHMPAIGTFKAQFGCCLGLIFIRHSALSFH